MRYLPHSPGDRQSMLGAIGVDGIDDLFRDVPDQARLDGPIHGLPSFKSELEVERILGDMAARNASCGSGPCFLGAGAYRHHVPATVDHLIQRGEFLTSYTPYQPEVSQGTLQSLFEFQTQVSLITGMEVANASMYDGATACAEAVLMANRITRRSKAIVSGGLHPHYKETVRTLARFVGFECIELAPDPHAFEKSSDLLDEGTSCVVVQTPCVFGHLHNVGDLAAACHARGALLIVVVTEIVSLGLVTPPGDMGADIVVAEGQSLGNALSFGGPHVGLFATRERFVRQMPGRLCGQTVDVDGRRGFVLTLSTREQHIRRDKATSNICTNSGLCALAFTIHLSLLGEVGFRRLAEINHANAVRLADMLDAINGVDVLNDAFFNEIAIRLPRPAGAVVDLLAERGVLAGVPATRLFGPDPELDTMLLVAVTEMNTDDDMTTLAEALGEAVS